MVILGYPMLHTKFQGHWSTGSGEEDFKGFYHIWAWWPYWSCDLEGLYKFFIPSAQGGSKRNLVTFGPVGYRRSLRLKIFLFFSMGGHLVYRSGTISAVLVGSHLGNIPMKFESHWPKGSGGVSFERKLFTIFYF